MVYRKVNCLNHQRKDVNLKISKTPSLLDKTIQKRAANSLKRQPDIRVDVLLECILKKLRSMDECEVKPNQYNCQSINIRRSSLSVPLDNQMLEVSQQRQVEPSEDFLGLDSFFMRLRNPAS